MAYDKVIERWNKLLSLIALKNTGTKKEVAKRLGVGASTIERDIEALNKISEMDMSAYLGSPVKYDRMKKSYVFTDKSRQ